MTMNVRTSNAKSSAISESRDTASLPVAHISGPAALNSKASLIMQQQRSTAASGAERRSTVSRTSRTIAACVVLSLAFFSAQTQAENLLLKRADGSTITNIPLLTSNGCAVVGGGDIEVRPQPAEGTAGDGWCPGSQVVNPPSFSAGAGGVPLSVTPTSLPNGGGAVSATWTSVSTVAQTCTGTVTLDGTGTTVSGWNGARAASQTAPGLSFNVTASGAYIFFITCTNSAGSTTSQSLTVTVAADSGTGCAQGMGPSFGLTRQTSMTNTGFLQGNSEWPNGSTQVTQFSFLAGPWPARTQNGTIAIQPNKFVALEFNTGTVTQATYGGTVSNPNRFGTIETSQAAANNGQILMAVSTCPGDFINIANNNNTRCRFSGGQGLWPWVVGMSDPFACRLEENTTYYLNLAYIDFVSQQSSCTNPEPTTGSNANSCHWFAQPR